MTAIATVTLNPTIDHSASVDHVVPERKLRCHSERFDPGGGGINVVRAIHQLGGEALAIWVCGGTMGKQLRALLDESGVHHEPIPIEQMTRENLIIYDERADQQFRFGMPGPTLSQQERQKCLDRVAALDQTVNYLILSGSLPPGMPNNFYSQLVEAAPDRIRIVLDTSGVALKEGVKSHLFMLKPNQRELGELTGCEIEGDHDVRDAARRLIDQGKTEVVVVSLGRGGMLMVTAEQELQIAAPAVKIRSKIGAGDSTVAGIVLALHRGKSLVEAARFGVACGTAAVMTDGTDLCRQQDAERLYQGMREDVTIRS